MHVAGPVAAAAIGVVGATVIANYVKSTKARNDALAGEKKLFPWATDEDNRKRLCTVRWYKRSIFGLNTHWALPFDWGDYKATYEADNIGGYLIPSWNKGDPLDYEWKEYTTFEVVCSPMEVNMKACAVAYNGAKYILTKVNCHLFAECLARALGIKHFELTATDLMFIPEPVASAVDDIYDNGGFAKNA